MVDKSVFVDFLVNRLLFLGALAAVAMTVATMSASALRFFWWFFVHSLLFLVICFVIFYLVEHLVENFIVPFRWIAVFIKKEEQILVKFSSYILVCEPVSE